MIKEFEKSKTMVHVFLCSRRLGKSWMLVAYADEFARKNPGSYIKFITCTTVQAREISQPLFNAILQTCPASMRPEYSVHNSKWTYPNGSEVLVKGTDADGGTSLRGQPCDLAIIDEAAFISTLETLIKESLGPSVIERNGRILLSSTPPLSADHAFLTYIARAKQDKALTKRVITDCPRHTEKQLKEFADQAGGVDSET